MLKAFFILSAIIFSVSESHASPTWRALPPLVDREIGVMVELDLGGPPQKRFSSCIPRESIAFPNKLSSELSNKIFSKKELSDFKACQPGACKHNFSDAEILEMIERRLKSDDDYKQIFFSFYQNRVAGRTPIQLGKSSWKITSDENPFSFCDGRQMKSILDQRPAPQAEFRLSAVQYDLKMRPTTRLLQGVFYQASNTKTECYVEALLFSNHYDLDRIEAWELSEENKLRLVIRHRIDLLSTWFRRLQKPKLQQSLEASAVRDITAAKNCLLTP
jgi:hypothetical protein